MYKILALIFFGLFFKAGSFAQLTHIKFQVRVGNVQSNMGDEDGFLTGDSDFQWEFSGASDGSPTISGSGCQMIGGNNNPNQNLNNIFINQTNPTTATVVNAQWRARENDDVVTDCSDDGDCRLGWYYQSLNIRSGSPCVWNNATQMVSGTTCGGQYRLTFAHYWEPVANSPTSITSSVPGTLCTGSSATLTAVFTDEATAGVTAETRWYTTGCNMTGHFATGNSITVSPTVNTTYYARRVITSACGNGNFSVSCATITVNVGGPAPTSVNAGSDVTYCTPGSTSLNGSANVSTGPWTASASPNLAIPDNNTTGATSTLNIPSTCANANNVTSLTINLSHTWTSDLSIFLVAPNLSQIDLSSGNGGSGDNYTNTVFSAAGTPITSGTAPFTGTFTPEQAFSTLTGTAQGNWGLRVVDGAGGDVGSILSWSITITNSTCGVITYSWSPATGLSSSTVANPTASPTTTTNYTLTASYNGCSATDQVLVTVNQPSTAPTSITGTTTICNGSSTTLTLSGGTAGTGATAQWFAGSCGSAVIGTGNSITVSPTANTTYFVRYAGTCNTTTCASVAVTVQTLSVAPTSITGTTTICNGSSTTLTLSGGTAGTGATAQWFAASCGSAVIGTGNSITVSPSSTTTYFVRYSGTCNTTTCASVVVTVNTLSTAPTAITGTTSICAGGSTTLTLSGGSIGTGAVARWYSGSCGGTLVGTGASITVSPGSTTTYFVRYEGTCNITTCASVAVTVNTLSTTPTITPILGSICPNTDVTLTASGGTAGTGSNIYWYTGPNGTGTFLGTGSSIIVTPNITATFYARRQGTCNTTTDATVVVTVKSFYYAANGTSSNSYCTDNAGWHHFYNGSQILFSVQGDLSGAPIGFPVASIAVNGAYYQQSVGPSPPGDCILGISPNEERFEMARSWNLDFGGGTPTGTYQVRFYYQPAEKVAIETAAANHMSTYAACGYTYKYAVPNGFYWFKNSGSNYSAPTYDDTHYSASGGSTVNGINYSQWSGISGFSGGSGAVILVPDALLGALPIDLTSFNAICNESAKEIKISWNTASEHNSSHFVLDRSFDGVHWNDIKTVPAAGNSNVLIDYQVVDDALEIREHDVVYYRLNQFDNDGTSKMYGPASAQCFDEKIGMELFPNPANQQVSILLHGDYENETYIVFTDMQGKEVKTVNYDPTQGKLYTVDLQGMEPGVYFVRLMDGNTNNQFVRFIKR